MKKDDHMPAATCSRRISLGMIMIIVLGTFCIVGLYIPVQADAAVAVLDAWPASPQLNGTTGNLTGTFTISAGSNRVLVVAVDCQDTGGSSGQTFSATYGGIALTQAVSENSNRRQTWIGYLNEAGITGRSGNTLSVTITGTHTNVSAHIASYQGVDQTATVTGSGGFYLNNTNPGTFPAAVSINAGGYGIYTFSSNQTRTNDSETYTEHSDYLNGLRMGVASKAFASAGTTRPSVTYAAAARASHSLVTLNPAPAGTPGNLQFSAFDYGVNEDLGNVTITVTRTGGSSGAASVNYATSNGTAVQPGDYTSASGTLNWADGDAAGKTFSVAIINDVIVESSETLNLTLSGATGASLGAPAAATITIADNDVAATPGITINPTSGLTTTEAGGTAQFTIVLDSAPTANVTIGLSSSDTTEGTVSPSSVTFTSGNWSAAQTVTVTGVDDVIVDGNISYTIATAAATSTDGSYSGMNAADVSVTNTDNDVATPGTLQLSSSSYAVDESAGTVAITVRRMGGSAGAASVAYATSDATAVQPGDYTPTSGTLNWANGDAADKIVTVSIINDATAEGNEVFNLTLSGATGASLGSPNVTTVTIPYNDGAPAPVPAGNWFTFISVFAGIAIYWIVRQRNLIK